MQVFRTPSICHCCIHCAPDGSCPPRSDESSIPPRSPLTIVTTHPHCQVQLLRWGFDPRWIISIPRDVWCYCLLASGHGCRPWQRYVPNPAGGVLREAQTPHDPVADASRSEANHEVLGSKWRRAGKCHEEYCCHRQNCSMRFRRRSSTILHAHIFDGPL